jgi:hypothetical protein
MRRTDINNPTEGKTALKKNQKTDIARSNEILG